MASASLVFRAIADPTRRAILDLLAGRSRAVHEIVSAFPVSQPAVSRHLRILREAGLVRETRVGRTHRYRFEPESLREVDVWVTNHRGADGPAVPNLRAWVDARAAGIGRTRSRAA